MEFSHADLVARYIYVFANEASQNDFYGLKVHPAHSLAIVIYKGSYQGVYIRMKLYIAIAVC